MPTMAQCAVRDGFASKKLESLASVPRSSFKTDHPKVRWRNDIGDKRRQGLAN